MTALRTSIDSIEHRNRKWELASAIIAIYEIVDKMEEGKLKQELMSRLLRVL